MLERWFPPLKPNQIALMPWGRFAPLALWLTIGVVVIGALAFIGAQLGYAG